VSLLNEGTHTYTRDQVLGAERWAWAGKLAAGPAEYLYDGLDFWRRDKGSGRRAERRMLAEAEAPAAGWWHKPECNCGLCRARSAAAGGVELDAFAAVVQASPGHVMDLRDWPGPQRTALRLRRPRSPVALSLAEVRESGLPALLLDFGEALLYLDGEIFEVDSSCAPLFVGAHPIPLPAVILATGVGIDYGWHHAGHCTCRFCSKGGRPDAQEASAA
jgi:hypothetical protein